MVHHERIIYKQHYDCGLVHPGRIGVYNITKSRSNPMITKPSLTAELVKRMSRSINYGFELGLTA
jgi:hypothetical protein